MLVLSTPKGLTELGDRQYGLLRNQRARHSWHGQRQHYVIRARSRGGLILWQGNFHEEADVWRFWRRLEQRELGYQDWVVPTPYYDPSLNDLPEVHYELAIVTTITASGNYTPSAAGRLDYLVQGGGAGGGGGVSGLRHGGGGAGCVPNIGFAIVAATLIVVTIAAIAAGGAPAGNGANGNSSSLGALATSTGALAGTSGSVGGANSAFAGGTGPSGSNGGGGAGGNGNGQNAGSGSNGGPGLSSSIDGTPTLYGGGGGGAAGGGGGTGGGGDSQANNAVANRGAGGGGAHANNGLHAGDGSTGVVIVSLLPNAFGFNLAMMGL